jgi:hypothetical protein
LLAVPADATSSSIAWGPCSDQVLAGGGAECGTVDVPLDHADPGGGKITLAVSRVRRRTTVSQGTVLAIPDPLSGAGYESSLLGADARRGRVRLGRVRPPRPCAERACAVLSAAGRVHLQPPRLRAGRSGAGADWLSRAKRYADACAADQPGLLDHMKTTDTVADMEIIRGALGVDRINLFQVASSASTLLVHETLSGATPYEGSLEVRSRFPNAALLAVPGGTSFGNVLTGNTCVDTTIANYLKTGALPARNPGRQADATCAL